VLGCVGSVGTWSLFDEVLACFKILQLQIAEARLFIVNRGEHEFIRARLRTSCIDSDLVQIAQADHQEMPTLISQMTAGTALYKPLYSKIATAPTKLAEFLGCGIPCLGNVGVGDMAEILEREMVGVALRGFNSDSRAAAVQRLIELAGHPDIAKRCVEVAHRYFSLVSGVQAYGSLYSELAR